MKKLIVLWCIALSLSFPGFGQAEDSSNTPKKNAFARMKENSREAARLADSAAAAAAASTRKSNTAIASQAAPSATPIATDRISAGGSINSVNIPPVPVNAENNIPAETLQAQSSAASENVSAIKALSPPPPPAPPPTKPQEIYRPTRLGSSTQQYSTYEKNDNGAGSVTTSPK
ncbi:MAG: hypothetical protein ABIR19_04140 [Ginsengibacter sp.]